MLVNRCSVLNKICSTIWHIENHRCFATPKSIPKLKTLITSALTEFFYVNIYVFFCCILLRFT